jgi:Kef-type K+ transport system membrane component KefB
VPRSVRLGLGALAAEHPWLEPITITDRERIEPFAEIGILMLLFGIGLELSFRRCGRCARGCSASAGCRC